MMKNILFGVVLLVLLTSVNAKAEVVSICNDVPCYVEGVLNFGTGILVPGTGGISSRRVFYIHYWDSTTSEWTRAACPTLVAGLEEEAYQIPAPLTSDSSSTKARKNAIYAAVSSALYADLPIKMSVDQITCQVSSVELLPRLSGHEYGARKNSGVTTQ